MSNDLVRVLLAVVVLAHGIGHVLFMPLAYSLMKTPATGHSWLLSSALGDGMAQAIATVVGLACLALFAAVAYGLWTQAAWWRPLAIAASILSLALIVAFWDGLPASSAVAGAAFDVLVLVALLVLRWPSETVVGA